MAAADWSVKGAPLTSPQHLEVYMSTPHERLTEAEKLHRQSPSHILVSCQQSESGKSTTVIREDVD